MDVVLYHLVLSKLIMKNKSPLCTNFNCDLITKPTTFLIYVFAVLLLGLSHPSSYVWAEENKVPVILDTDMGADDWLALAFIAKNPRFELLGVSVVGNGLSICPQAANNASFLLSLSGKANVPVACGSNWPMDGFASYPTPWREDSIQMLGESLPAFDPLRIYGDSSVCVHGPYAA